MIVAENGLIQKITQTVNRVIGVHYVAQTKFERFKFSEDWKIP
jgi:hypothetical protein